MVDKIFHILAYIFFAILFILLVLFFIVLPFYHKNKISYYSNYRIKGSWNGKEGVDTLLPLGGCYYDCFGEETTIKCVDYSRKYEKCEMKCKGVLCGSCSQEGILNDIRCYQLYLKER
jgi:hypothetical protein